MLLHDIRIIFLVLFWYCYVLFVCDTLCWHGCFVLSVLFSLCSVSSLNYIFLFWFLVKYFYVICPHGHTYYIIMNLFVSCIIYYTCTFCIYQIIFLALFFLLTLYFSFVFAKHISCFLFLIWNLHGQHILMYFVLRHITWAVCELTNIGCKFIHMHISF